jgi:hypothetical protein
MDSWEENDLSSLDLCSSCLAVAKSAYYNARIINWDELKSYFGLLDIERGSEASIVDSDPVAEGDSEASDTERDSVGSASAE